MGLTKKEYELLKAESQHWVSQGYVTNEQRGQILASYGQGDLEHNRLTITMAILGALLLGAGVIMFFASNWQALSKEFKLFIIFGALLTSYGLGYYLSVSKANYPRVGHSLVFLGTVLFGAAIHLVAQIFHIEAHYPNGVLFWSLGILPMAWVNRSKPILWETLALVTLWVNLEVQGFQTLAWLFWPIMLIGILPLVYQLQSVTGLTLALGSCYLWLAQTNIWWVGVGILSPIVVTIIALSVYLIGYQRFNLKLAGFQSYTQGVSLTVVFLSLFVMTFDIFNWSKGLEVPVSFYITVLLALLFLLVSSVATIKAGYELKEALTVAGFALAGTFFAIGWLNGLDYRMAILGFNLVLFASILWSIYQGYITQRPFMVNIGLVAFVIDLIARYFDFLWQLLDKSIFFILGGLLLLVGGSYLEKKRRQLLSQMGGNTYEQA